MLQNRKAETYTERRMSVLLSLVTFHRKSSGHKYFPNGNKCPVSCTFITLEPWIAAASSEGITGASAVDFCYRTDFALT